MTRVLFFSTATSATVCSRRSCSAPGVPDILAAATLSCSDACRSPSAAITRARRSRSASACRDIDRVICSGSAMSRSSTSSMRTPHGCSVGASISVLSSALMRCLSDRSVSRSARPITVRSEVWATRETALR